jgi:hypothetical protein
MTHAQLRRARQKAAAMVAAGKSVAVVVRRFGRGMCWVRGACQEYGVRMPRGHWPRFAGNTVGMIADLLAGQKTQTEIAKARGVSRQRVGQVAELVERAGYRLVGRRRRELS